MVATGSGTVEGDIGKGDRMVHIVSRLQIAIERSFVATCGTAIGVERICSISELHICAFSRRERMGCRM